MKKAIENKVIGIFVSFLLALVCFFLYKTLDSVGIDAKIMMLAVCFLSEIRMGGLMAKFHSHHSH